MPPKYRAKPIPMMIGVGRAAVRRPHNWDLGLIGCPTERGLR